MAGKSDFKPIDIAREEVRKSKTADSRTIAKKLCKLYPKIWPTIDNARSTVRRLRGAMGTQKAATVIPRVEIPKADHAGWKEHELPSEVSRWLYLSDIHFPYHSPKSLKLALEFGREQGCDGLLLNGDVVDFCPISVFEKDPRIRNFEGEVDVTNRGLDAMDAILKPKRRLWKGGNHEARFARYLMQRVPEMFSELDKHFNMESVFGLKARGIDWIPDRHFIRHRKLTILHGHEFGNRFASPVNPARGAFLKAHACVIMGHEHKTSDHMETTLDQVSISCWSTGCLCNLRPAYRPVNSWNHGFAIIDVTGSSWAVRNYRVIGEKEIA